MNSQELITVTLPADILAATGGMMLQLGDSEVAQEFSQQVLHQLGLALLLGIGLVQALNVLHDIRLRVLVLHGHPGSMSLLAIPDLTESLPGYL